LLKISELIDIVLFCKDILILFNFAKVS